MDTNSILQDYNDCLTPKEVMKILVISRNKVYELLANKTIPSLKIDKQYRIPKEKLIEYIYGNASSNNEEDWYGKT